MWGGERLGGAGGGTAHISYTSCKTCSLVVSLSRAHSSAVSKQRGRVGREGEAWRREGGEAARMELMRQCRRCLSLSLFLPPPTYTHRQTETQSISRERARAHELSLSIYALYSLLFFQGGNSSSSRGSDKKQRAPFSRRESSSWSTVEQLKIIS